MFIYFYLNSDFFLIIYILRPKIKIIDSHIHGTTSIWFEYIGDSHKLKFKY